MSSDSGLALRAHDLGKSYRLFDRPQDWLKQGFWRRRKYFREFWALRGVSFFVRKGETVGIIGRNGSGKSTLLQIIAGTLTPTTGTLQISGRVAALLELGTGFTPDFTGRENVFLNAAILGFSRPETEGRFQEIVDFAEIGDFIDQPVRTYSSGMLVRLAFAVQVLVPKDVLIVDEILAVGDEAFQRKCFAKIEDFRGKGGTVLFVSHAAGLVVQLCERAILLDHGELLLEGHSKEVVHLYQRLVHAPSTAQEELRREIRNWGSTSGWVSIPSPRPPEKQDGTSVPPSTDTSKPVERKGMYDPHLVSKNIVRYKSRGARIHDPHLTMPDGSRVNLLEAGERYTWRYRVIFEEPFRNVRFGMLIKTVSGLELGGGVTAAPGDGISSIEAGTIVEALFSFRANLAPGTYFLNAGLVATLPEGEVYLDRWVDAVIFKVLPVEKQRVTGLVDFSIEPHLILEGKGVAIP